ncbi:hypothetical protein EBZ39_06430 [bacterium]|nr:hypothetical protein [bacterium]
MISLPSIKVVVLNEHLTDFQKPGTTEAYLLAADCRPGSIIKFTVYLSGGAVWSGLPIEAIFCDRFSCVDISKKTTTDVLQPFSCLEGPVSILTYDLIKHSKVQTKIGPGHYLFTINYEGCGLSEDPEQHKTHNIIILSTGQLCALPNNFIKIVDNWFSDNSDNDLTHYKRTKKFFFPGG